MSAAAHSDHFVQTKGGKHGLKTLNARMLGSRLILRCCVLSSSAVRVDATCLFQQYRLEALFHHSLRECLGIVTVLKHFFYFLGKCNVKKCKPLRVEVLIRDGTTFPPVPDRFNKRFTAKTNTALYKKI